MKSSLIAVLLVSGLATACGEAPKEAVTEQTIEAASPDFQKVDKELSARFFALRPEMATVYGFSDADAGKPLSAMLSSYDPVTEVARRAVLEILLLDIKAIDTSDFMPQQRTAMEMIAFNLEGSLTPARTVDYGSVVGEYGTWFLPYLVSHLTGPHVEVRTTLEDKAPVKTMQDVDSYLSRLKAWPGVVEGIKVKLDHDKELGVIPPDFVIDNSLGGLADQLAVDPAEHSLVTTFVEKIEASDIEDKVSHIDAVKKAMADFYYPGIQALSDKLTELRPLASHDVGMYRLPDGEALYAAMIRHMTDDEGDPKAIHQLGLSEVARIHSEMDVLLKKLGKTEGTVGERMEVLLNDPQYLYEDSDAGRAQLIADMRADLNKINPLLPDWFGTVVTEEVAIKAIPVASQATGCGGCYAAPSKESGTQGTFWINLKSMASLPSYGLQTLTYHETNPGHHFQVVIGLSDDIPLLSSVLYSNAAGEGWGLYAEALAAEMGIYEGDTVDDIGRLQAELHRAVRLVVDTGMHALGWTREQAIDYSIKTEGIHIDEATAEVERYAIWPGQALGYKLGQLKLVELRERARAALGDQFDIREFHDQVLESGSIPLNMLEDKINFWIATFSGPAS